MPRVVSDKKWLGLKNPELVLLNSIQTGQSTLIRRAKAKVNQKNYQVFQGIERIWKHGKEEYQG